MYIDIPVMIFLIFDVIFILKCSFQHVWERIFNLKSTQYQNTKQLTLHKSHYEANKEKHLPLLHTEKKDKNSFKEVLKTIIVWS